MREVDVKQVKDEIKKLFIQANTVINDDVIMKFNEAIKIEENDTAREMLLLMKENFMLAKKEKTAIGWQNMRADKYYAMQPDPENIFNYFCIPAELWDKIKPRFKKGDSVYYKYKDNLLKEQKSFFKIMSQCGLTGFGFNHINVHNTPFICDKYNEKNPVPFKTYDEIVKGTK